MSIEKYFSQLEIDDESRETNYQYIKVFKNPNKLPINQIYLERLCRELKKDLPKELDLLNTLPAGIENTLYEKKIEIIPALDKRWLPKTIFHKFEPYQFTQERDENTTFLGKNILFLGNLDYLLNCNYHQFWCTIFFEPSAAIALQSFLLNPILPFQINYLEDEYYEIYKTLINKFLLVYEKLLIFKQSEFEYMPESFGLQKLIQQKLINLPVVITLASLYKNSNEEFINRVSSLYFEETQFEFIIKEVENMVEHNLIVLEMLGGHLCGFDESAVIVPVSIEKRPSIFCLTWIYSFVTYLSYTVFTMNILFDLYKPAVEIALNKKFPHRIPYVYVSIYKELYELLNGREEIQTREDMYKKVIEEISLGRSEFIEFYHTFVSHCLDKALENIGDKANQEIVVEMYLKLMTTALEEDYFICDYNASYNVANQNEMFESCCDIDPTRTEFIVSCINKLSRNKKLQELSKLKRRGIEEVFRKFTPAESNKPEIFEPQPGPSGESNQQHEIEIEEDIRSIMDMFPHLGDGFILQCLESYNFNRADVINAILENNLPPHLSEIQFDQIRIPPEPEPEKPILAYKGKKPQYDDALKLLNDKNHIKDIKNFVLEGIHYGYDYMYDDEYDDRFDDDLAIKVSDNPLTEELPTFNPNRRNIETDTDDTSSEEEDKNTNNSSLAKKLNFLEDPAILRQRRELKYRTKQPQDNKTNNKNEGVTGKSKGQGQDKSTILNRQKKTVNKSSRANHNRKSGAQWKRSKGMFPS